MGFFKNLREGLNLVGDVSEAEAMAQAQEVYASLGMTMPGTEPAAPAAPVRAPGAVPIAFTRVTTRGGSQLEELAAFLGASGLAAAPERVWGVYRVPDRLQPTQDIHSEKRTPVEWDVVHEPVQLPACAPPRLTCFAAKEQWVARREGEPSVLDEDLGVALGLDPERCLGLARVPEFVAVTGRGNDVLSGMGTFVTGLVAVSPDPLDAFERMRDERPLALPPRPDVVCEVLDWTASGTSPQELLRAYLEIVGVRPRDCYSAQATVDTMTELPRTNADRAPGCEVVVVVYRDTPEYAAGRERWPRPDLRRPLRSPVSEAPSRAWRALELANSVYEGSWPDKDAPPHRYCWPPIKS